MKYYAELNQDRVCISILGIPEEKVFSCEANCVEIDDNDVFLLNKRLSDDGVWEEVDPMYFYRPLSEQEAATLQMQSDIEYLVCLKELGI